MVEDSAVDCLLTDHSSLTLGRDILPLVPFGVLGRVSEELLAHVDSPPVFQKLVAFRVDPHKSIILGFHELIGPTLHLVGVVVHPGLPVHLTSLLLVRIMVVLSQRFIVLLRRI